jgi:hypothetical protein
MGRKAQKERLVARFARQLGVETRKYGKLTLAIARVMGTE